MQNKKENEKKSITFKSLFPRIHLGKNETVHIKNVIGFFEIDGATESETTKDFLKKNEKEYKIINLLYDLPKCFVLTSDKDSGTENVYMLSNSVETEIKRMGEN